MACTTTAIAGYGGSITGVDTASEISNWTLTIVVDLLDSTYIGGDGWRVYISGLSSATGTMECYGDYFPNGSHGDVVLTLADNRTFTFTMKVGESTITSPVDEKVTYSCNFTACGAVAISE